jgi:predicted TIM-barrel fold metal-dependent hydrolase
MSKPEYRVISADSHVIEPYDLWNDRVPAKFRDRLPKLVREENTDVLVCADVKLPSVSMLAGCYRKDDEQRWEGRWDEDVPVSAYDPGVRLKDLALDGVDAEVVFPTLGLQFFSLDDFEFRWAMFRAYNDWLAEEFCGAFPDQFFGIAMLDTEDVDSAVAELARAKELGLAGAMVPMYSTQDDPYYSERFDPLWAASIDLQMPLNFHLLTSREKLKLTEDGSMPSPGKLMSLAAGIQPLLVDLIAYGLFDRFPELVVVSAENDAGWAAHLMQTADYNWKRVYRLGGPRSEQEPSHYFHHNLRMTFMRDRAAIVARDIIGVETMMWGNDFPHETSTWPHSAEAFDELFHDQPQEVRDAIVCGNVRALYDF